MDEADSAVEGNEPCYAGVFELEVGGSAFVSLCGLNVSLELLYGR